MRRVRPLARDEQLELHRPPSALAAAFLDEVQQRPSDARVALVGRRDQDPELARVLGDVVDAHAAHDGPVAAGDDDLAGPDLVRQLPASVRFAPSRHSPRSATL